MPNTHISVLLERPIDQYKQTHLGDFGLASATGRTVFLEVLLLFAEPPPPCGAPRTASFVDASVRFITVRGDVIDAFLMGLGACSRMIWGCRRRGRGCDCPAAVGAWVVAVEARGKKKKTKTKRGRRNAGAREKAGQRSPRSCAPSKDSRHFPSPWKKGSRLRRSSLPLPPLQRKRACFPQRGRLGFRPREGAESVSGTEPWQG
mmetsp:Transcript_34159/g.62474  ORF Transcript_34159/g.62474 Transcript_34159/m.62474 type:complete len:204 (-) Transcript_34159:193-804(-)